MSASRSMSMVAIAAALSALAACGGGGGSGSGTDAGGNHEPDVFPPISSSSSSSSATTSSTSSSSNESSTSSSSSSLPADNNDFVDAQIGFSTLNGGTTGGAGGAVVTVTTGTELNAALCNRATKTTPVTILVKGTINHGNTTKQSGQCNTADDVIELKDISNISLIGVGNQALFDQIGIHIRNARNIIIRNVHVRNVKKSGSPTSNGGDAIGMESDVSNVWVDHVTLEASGGEKEGFDALFDVKDNTKYVTLSWSILMNSERGGLVGSGTGDDQNGPITYHHNYYQNLKSRMPLLRYATAHSFNNYFDGIADSGMNPRLGGQIKAENNYFTNAKNPIGTFYDTVMGFWDVSGNIFTDTVTWVPSAANKEYPAGPNPVSTTSITIPYSYELHDAAAIPAIVQRGAGAGKMPDSLLPGGGGGDEGNGSSSSAPSSSSSSSSSSSNSSAASSSSSSSSAGAESGSCTAAFVCDTGAGEGHMSSAITATGSSSFDSGTWSIEGAGAMSTSSTYNHYFKYMPLTGDFTITARIVSQGGNHANARAGLLAAEALGSGAYVWAARYSSTGEIRASINGNNGSAISGVGNTALPDAWVRIRRVGNDLWAEASSDGTSFVNRGSKTLSSAQETLYVGFALSSNDNANTVGALFDKLSIEGGGL